MDSPAGGSAPNGDDPFRRSSRLSRSPTRIVEITVQGDGTPAPAVETGDQSGLHTTAAITSNRSAVVVASLAPAATVITSQRKISDLISVPTQKIAQKSPPGSPIRPFDLSAYQNEGLRSILDMMSARINIVLSAFETQRHVTKETKGAITELAALNSRTIQLQEGTGKEASSRNTATQKENRQMKDHLAAAPKNVAVKPHPVMPSKPTKTASHKVKEPHPVLPTVPSKTANPKEKEPKPVSYATVAKDACKGGVGQGDAEALAQEAGGYHPQKDWRSFVRRHAPYVESRSQIK